MPTTIKKSLQVESNATGKRAGTARVLDKAVLNQASKIVKDPKRAKEFLHEAGIITKSGRLTANYKN